MVQHVRGVEALAAGRTGEAFRQFHRIFDPADAAYHPVMRLHAVGHLIEAADRGGRQEELAALVAELEPLAGLSGSPVLAVTLPHARAVLAPAAEAGPLYETALAGDLGSWPFERARLQLGYGAWLRRQRRPADSRPLLRAAAGTFDALGATPWAERARQELRASGESLRAPDDAIGRLTPQEQQIAQLAAEGLSNREVAERLFLSPRTVTTHLYRIYPKLGISSRAELAGVLRVT
jgi:DNA-binding CsgD family transcriptional regulator